MYFCAYCLVFFVFSNFEFSEIFYLFIFECWCVYVSAENLASTFFVIFVIFVSFPTWPKHTHLYEFKQTPLHIYLKIYFYIVQAHKYIYTHTHTHTRTNLPLDRSVQIFHKIENVNFSTKMLRKTFLRIQCELGYLKKRVVF